MFDQRRLRGSAIRVVTCAVGLVAASGGAILASRPMPRVAQRSAVLSTRSTAGLDISAVDNYFRRAGEFGFSGSVVIGAGGELLFHAGYGQADWKAGTPALSTTAYDIASLDKQFIAAGILKLEEAHKLATTDPLSRFFDFVPSDKAITLHHLLSHTSGLQDIYWDDFPDLTRLQFIEHVLTKTALLSAPGQAFRYSNANYWILEGVLERVSGKTAEQFLRDTLFLPSGMRATGTLLPTWQHGQVAHLRTWSTGTFPFKGLDYGDLLARPPAFRSLLSTADDLFAWYVSIRSHHVLSQASTAKWLTPVLARYAYGWNVVPTSRGTTLIEHGGGGTGAGMRATFRYFPQEDVFFAILSGAIDPGIQADYVAKDVEGLLFGGPVNLPPGRFAPHSTSPPDWVAGTYALAEGGRFEVVPRPDHHGLLLRSTDARTITILRFPDLLAPVDQFPQDEDARALVRDILNGSYDALHLRFHGSDEAFARYTNGLDRLREQARLLGEAHEITTVFQRSYDFEGASEFQTFIGVRFQRADAILRVLRTSGDNMSFDPIRSPDRLELSMGTLSDTDYAVWDFTLGRAVRFVFTHDDRGGAVEIRGQHAMVRALRVAGST